MPGNVVFKALFGSADSKHILKSFLKSILVLPEEDYEEIYIADTNSRITKVEDKLSVLDLKLKMKTGKIINIEIQIVNEKNLENRIRTHTQRRNRVDNDNQNAILSKVKI